MSVKLQRQHIRLETRQMARVSLPERPVLRCEIRDFCQTGLYLRVLDELSPEALTTSLIGLDAEVEVEPKAGTNLPAHHLSGRIAHVSSAGIGLQTAALPEKVSRSLLEARYNALPTALLLPSGLTAQEVRAVQQECIGRYRVFLHDAMHAFFALAEQKSVDGSSSYLTIAEESRFINSLLALKINKTEINERFLAVVLEKVQHMGQEAGEAGLKDELALVDDDSFADWLNLAAVISQIEGEIFSPLGMFEQRYSQILMVPISKLNDPFGPHVVCHAFQAAVRELEMDNASRGLVYKLFGSVLLPAYPDFYARLNDLLAPLKPVFAKSTPSHPPTPEGPAAPMLPSAMPGMPASDGREAPSWNLAELAEKLFAHPASPSAPGQPAAVGQAASAEALGYGLNQVLATLRQPLPAMAAAPTAPLRGGRELIRTADTLRQTLRQISGMPLPARDSLVAGLPPATEGLPEATLSELLFALEALLRTQGGKPRPKDAPPLSEELGKQLQQAAGGGRRIASRHQSTLGVLDGLFDQARTEYVHGSDLESLMQRLEGPIMKLALQDSDFLQSEAHPARRMLNLLDSFAIAADDSGRFFDPELAKALTSLADRVAATWEEDPSVYEKSCVTLDKMLLHLQRVRRQRIAAYQEVCEGQERIKQARVTVARHLEDLLGGRVVHRLLPNLLEIGWRQYLVLLEMRQGTSSTEWAEVTAVLEQLGAWLSPEYVPGDGHEIEVVSLLERVRERLATVNLDARQQAQFMAQLEGLLLDPGKAEILATDMVQVPGGRYVKAEGTEGGPTWHDKLAGRLRVGDWWEFARSEGRLPMQLIWLSQPGKSCAFVNRSATQKVELAGAELAQQWEAGTATLTEDRELPLMERSLNARVNSMYRHLIHHSTHDPITNLLNRKGLLLHMGRADSGTARDKGQVIAVLEVEQYQMIMRSCGAEGGEDLLRRLAGEIQARIGSDDRLAALREGAFAIHMPACDQEEGLRRATELLQWLKGYRYQHGENSLSIGASIGLAEVAAGLADPGEALRRADSACLAARSAGDSPIQFYEAADASLAEQEAILGWAGRIDRLIERNGLYLRCQMVKPLNGDPALLPYYEILLGINDEHGAPISPQQFIQAVEHWKRSADIDLWVVDRAFQWIRANHEVFAGTGGFSINLSASSLASADVLARLHEELGNGDLPGDKIIFEITETATIDSYADAQDFIQQIKRYGCKFCIDDFGSGNATYTYLKNLRTDTLKIDGSFVKDMIENPMDLALVKSMNEIAHSLGMHTVAEYVATAELLKLLEEIGVDYVQGYAVHKPTRLDDLCAPAP